jgi:hypothetical protein
MIEEFGNFYSSCEFNKPFCWVMKLNILREATPMESFWGRLGELSLEKRSLGRTEREKKTDCKESSLILSNSGLDIRGVKFSDSVKQDVGC